VNKTAVSDTVETVKNQNTTAEKSRRNSEAKTKQ
jgi:hypothetical protein